MRPQRHKITRLLTDTILVENTPITDPFNATGVYKATTYSTIDNNGEWVHHADIYFRNGNTKGSHRMFATSLQAIERKMREYSFGIRI